MDINKIKKLQAEVTKKQNAAEREYQNVDHGTTPKSMTDKLENRIDSLNTLGVYLNDIIDLYESLVRDVSECYSRFRRDTDLDMFLGDADDIRKEYRNLEQMVKDAIKKLKKVK